MFSGHGPDFIYDTVALTLSTIPVLLVGALIAASWLEEPLRVRAVARSKNQIADLVFKERLGKK